MVDEKDLLEEKRNFFEVQAKFVQKKFEKRRIHFHPCFDKNEAQDAIKKIISEAVFQDPEMKEIAFSDSVTLHQLDVYDVVEKLANEKDLKVNNPFERFDDGKLKAYGKQPEGKLDVPKEEYVKLQKKWLNQLRSTLLADFLSIGANAITQDGDIVSTDGAGNRVAGMIFGPRKVIVVVGRNKLVKNIEQAIDRNRNIAAPLNYIRHNMKHHNRYNTPCLETGKCSDCNHPRRACLNTVIISGAVEANKDRIHLVFVNDDLGL